MSDDEFSLPEDIEVDRHETGIVRVRFTYGQEDVLPVHLDQNRLQSLITLLQEKIESDRVAPISPSMLLQNAMIAVKGIGWKKTPRNTMGLTLLAEVDGRKVTIPLEIDRVDIEGLIRASADMD